MDFEYEKKFLDDFVGMLKLYKPFLYQKINETGIITSLIGKEFGIKEPEYYLAGYYANLGLLGVGSYLQKPGHLNVQEKEVVKRHPILSHEYLEKRGLVKCADFVYYHHELPDGSGYYKETNFPKEASFINIADAFQGCVSPRNYRPPFTFREAIETTMKPYKNYIFLQKEEVDAIEKILKAYYETL